MTWCWLYLYTMRLRLMNQPTIPRPLFSQGTGVGSIYSDNPMIGDMRGGEGHCMIDSRTNKLVYITGLRHNCASSFMPLLGIIQVAINSRWSLSI